MAIEARIVDFDHLFHTSTRPPMLVNDFNIDTQEDRDKLNKLIYTYYEGDSLKVLPACECGEITSEFNVGITCQNCGQVVRAITERELESILWIRPPDGVKTLINPVFWAILSEYLTYSSVNLLRWMCDPTYIVSSPAPKILKRLQETGIERGLNFFYDNFDAIHRMLVDRKIYKPSKSGVDALDDLVQRYRKAIFTQYLPIPSKLGFITEKTITGSYADPTMAPAVNAIRTISATVNSYTPLQNRVLQSRTVKTIMLLTDYYQTFISNSLAGKYGWWRKHVLGSRLHFTFRAVISSLSDNHDYDELHLPWSLSVMVFRLHLESKLNKRGFTPRESAKFLHEHTARYHPLIDELFQEIFEETPDKGFPVLFNRNPSLARASIQCLRVTKVKTDPHINSISMSVLILKGPNADFDGDALNGMLILDNYMYKHLRRLEPHLGVLDLKSPRKLSKNIALPPPIVTTIGGWMYEGR